MNKISYGKQEILEEDLQAVREVLQSEYMTQGPTVEKFEKAFSELVKAPYSLAVQSATAGLHLAVLALGIKPGQKVLCPTISFVASANCVRYAGGEIEFIDIDPKTFCLDIKSLEEKLKKSKPGEYAGVVTVHMAGYPADMEVISNLVKPYHLWIIEDSCHAPGAYFTNSKGEKVFVGSSEYSDASTFSFHPVKHIATGEGGMVTTRNRELFDKMKLLRSHGIERSTDRMSENHGGWYYEMQELGFNYRIPDVLCALGLSQIKRFDQNILNRQNIANLYDRELTNKVQKPFRHSSMKHGFHLYVIQTDHRKDLYDYLKTKDIYTQVHYIPIHTQPYYVERYGKQTLPAAEKYYSQALSLPMYHSLTKEDQLRVIGEVNNFFINRAKT